MTLNTVTPPAGEEEVKPSATEVAAAETKAPAEDLSPTTAPEASAPAAAVEDDGWQEVASDLGKTIRWNEEARNSKEAENTIFIGSVVKGLYTEKRENIGENSATIYQVNNVEHGMLNIWSTTVLADKMKRVWEGNEVMIECTGEQTPKAGGKAYKLFKVNQRPATQELMAQLNAEPAKTDEQNDDSVMEDPQFD